MTKYKHHKYTWTPRFDTIYHRWEMVGPLGGLHLSVSIYKDTDPACGLEFHHAARCNYSPGRAPDHINCPVIGEPCWHDGTSLYARESVWPAVEIHLVRGEHDAIFRLLEWEADRHFGDYEPAPATPAQGEGA